MAILLKIEADEDCFFDRIITGDETWVYQYDSETKQQSKQWLSHGSSGPIKFKSERSVKKVMATVFWDSKGVVLVDFLEGKKTVTGAYCVEVLRKLKAKLAEKCPEKLHHGIIFHHNNTPAHSSQIVRDVLREFWLELLPHPPYSPDLAPSDFFLFSNLKEHSKASSKTWLTKWSADYFKNGIKGWKHCLEKCISTLIETTLKSRLIVSINYKKL